MWIGLAAVCFVLIVLWHHTMFPSMHYLVLALHVDHTTSYNPSGNITRHRLQHTYSQAWHAASSGVSHALSIAVNIAQQTPTATRAAPTPTILMPHSPISAVMGRSVEGSENPPEGCGGPLLYGILRKVQLIHLEDALRMLDGLRYKARQGCADAVVCPWH